MSATVDKALDLLNHFTQQRPHIGLSEMARIARIDKATTHRMLNSLAKYGLVEQERQTKLYRLGAAPLRLARTREACFPVSTLVEPVLQQLMVKTGETAHASLLAGEGLATVGLVTGKKAIHVTLGAGELLPLHATASGIACLAFMPEEFLEKVLKQNRKTYTEHTQVSAEEISQQVGRTRLQGFALSDQTYEADVFGIAAPFFLPSSNACGAVAVATPAHRMNKNIKADTIQAVIAASQDITRRLGAEAPPAFTSAVRKLLA